ATERGDEHEQRGARQVEVGDESIDGPVAVAGTDEEAGPAAARRDDAILTGDALQRAGHGRADAPHRTSTGPYLVDRVRRFRRHLVPLLVHRVLARVLDLDRPERTYADVQQDARDSY